MTSQLAAGKQWPLAIAMSCLVDELHMALNVWYLRAMVQLPRGQLQVASVPQSAPVAVYKAALGIPYVQRKGKCKAPTRIRGKAPTCIRGKQAQRTKKIKVVGNKKRSCALKKLRHETSKGKHDDTAIEPVKLVPPGLCKKSFVWAGVTSTHTLQATSMARDTIRVGQSHVFWEVACTSW